MLPRATATRTPREVSKGRASGRTMEIQRLIGRSLRSIVDLDALGERSIILDCDVLQADGGTRTAAITGAYIALSVAVRKLLKFGTLKRSPIRDYVAATSVGVVGGVPMLDLCYQEDSQAEVDMNVVMTGSGQFVELQATAEKTAFDDEQLGLADCAGPRRHRRVDPGPEISRSRMIVYCATSNPGKLREFQLAAPDFDVRALPKSIPPPDEHGRYLRSQRHRESRRLWPARRRLSFRG